MAASSGRQTTLHIKTFIKNIRQHILLGDAEKLYSDDNFVLDLLKFVYEDSIESVVKTELVLSLEEHGYLNLNTSSVEQVISSLIDVFNQNINKEDRVNFCIQLLISLTSITIQHNQLNTSLGGSVIKKLWDVLCNVNHLPSRRLRGCSCQCLSQIEEFSPGLTVKYRDQLVKMVKDEKTYVSQDYVILLTRILHASIQDDDIKSTEHNDKELLPSVSYIMENVPLLTTSGLWSIIKSLINILQNTPAISPSIFKPLILHHMASFDPIVFHIVLYLQKEFDGDVLSPTEENQLLTRLVIGINHPLLSPAHRLLFVQWLKGYGVYSNVSNATSYKIPQFVSENYESELYPSVFDSLDLQVGKLTLLSNSLSNSQTPSQGEDVCNILLKHCSEIQQLTEYTGRHKPALALYKSLYVFYCQHSSPYLIQAIQKITDKLLEKYPALIPLVLDFLQCVRQCSSESDVYMDILSTLHQSVLSISYQDVFKQYQFYLQVFQTSAREKVLNPSSTVKYLHGLVDCSLTSDLCDWYFGNTVLSVCRNILSHQDTENIFSDLGVLLFEMMTYCDDTDIKDRARFYYSLLTNAADKKIHSVLSESLPGGKFTGQNFSSLLPGSMNEQQQASITYLSETLFTWERFEIVPVFSMTDENVEMQDYTFEEYKNILKNMVISLSVTYKLTMLPVCEYDTIHAVSVKLEASDAYKPIKECHVTVMNKSDSSDVRLTLHPVEPKPASLPSSAIFAVENMTFSSPLSASKIYFPDLLIPFPWQLLNIDKSSQFKFWSNLWSKFTDSSNYPSNGVESHKIASCSLNKLKSLWKSYEIQGEKENIFPFLMLLPPGYHILLQVKTRKQNLVISIATDHWTLLPSINNYLNSLNN